MTRRLAEGWTILFAVIATTACGGDDAGVPARDAAALRSTNTCDVREGGSRWVPVGGRYAAVAGAEYGRREGEELADVWGLAATPDGSVFILDGGNSEVVKLDAGFRFVRRFGREGKGPGEFAYQRVSALTAWAAADDSSLYIMDIRGVSEFDPSGDFRRYVGHGVPILDPAWRIAARYGRVVYSVDRIDRAEGTRVLETWQYESTMPHTLLRADTMPPLPKVRGRPILGGFSDQARPLWAVHRRCAFVSDGAGDWILRVDLTENRADTLPLPPREIPARTAEDEARLEREREMIAGFMARVGATTDELRRVQPTARLKWSGMAVDPDGFVWLEPWRPYSMQDDPLTVWVVHPATGAVDSVVIESGTFPAAFLPDGRFVALARDTATHVRFIRSYALEHAMK